MRLSPAIAFLLTSSLSVAGAQSALQPNTPATPPTNPQRASLKPSYSQLPLSFEANQGQTNPNVRFLSHGNGYSLFLTDSEAVLTLAKDPVAANKAAKDLRPASDIIHMHLAGVSHASRIEPSDPLPGIVNYFIGKDPANWQANVPTYERVKYTGVYPGVDLIYYGRQGQLEYDFVVAPYAKAAPIQLQFAGSSRISLEQNGDLAIEGKDASVSFQKPEIYQIKDGQRQPVEGRFQLLAKDTVGFQLGVYDHARELVIDPSILYSSIVGGRGPIAVDSKGYIYTVGSSSSGSSIIKLNLSATTALYSTYFSANIGSIAVDGEGNAYLTGSATAPDFPVVPGAFQTTNSPNGKAFVTKLNPTGSALIYSTLLGGSNGYGDAGDSIAVDATGDAYVVGQAQSTDFPTTPGAYETTPGTGFLTKMNSSGTKPVYSTYLPAWGISLSIDSSGNAYVGGRADEVPNFPTTPGAFNTTRTYTNYVLKMNSSGSALVYSTYFPTWQTAIDTQGNVYGVNTNENSDTGPITPGAYRTTGHGWVGKLNTTGSALVYGTYVAKDVQFSSIAVDQSGNVYLAGGSASTNFPVTFDAYQKTYKGIQLDDSPSPTNAVLAKLNKDGNYMLYATYLGGTGYVNEPDGAFGDYAQRIVLDRGGDPLISGYTYSSDFPQTPGKPKAPLQHGMPSPAGFVAGFDISGLQPETALLDFGATEYRSGGNGGIQLLEVYDPSSSDLVNFTTQFDARNFKMYSSPGGSCTASCYLTIEFTPAGVGVHTNTLTLTTDRGGLVVVVLRGLAAGVGPVSEGSLGFGSVALGTSNTLPLVIGNYSAPGSPTVKVVSHSAAFTVAPGSTCSSAGVKDGQTCYFNVTFTPTTVGPASGSITVTPSLGAASIVPLTGNGVSQ